MRLFAAIELSEDVRAALSEVQRSLGGWSRTVRWTPAEQLHLTAKFLGDTKDAAVSGIADSLDRVAASARGFDLTLTECGCFPPRGAVRIVWVGASEASGALAGLVEAVETALEPLGFAREARPFSPHLTIGRVREDGSGGALRAAVERVQVRKASQRVSALTLMSSELSPKGPSYSVVRRATLNAEKA